MTNRRPTMKLKDKVAIITGAAAPQGLGFAIATAFANEGAKVAISDINEAGVKESAKELIARGKTALALRCDVSSVESVQQMFAEVLKEFATVDILVNNAALIPTSPRTKNDGIATMPTSRPHATSVFGHYIEPYRR
jgi:NAD(P)-dependent dehydrogenase (short-subunit alcohol dehydrogenase family)